MILYLSWFVDLLYVNYCSSLSSLEVLVIFVSEQFHSKKIIRNANVGACRMIWYACVLRADIVSANSILKMGGEYDRGVEGGHHYQIIGNFQHLYERHKVLLHSAQ